MTLYTCLCNNLNISFKHCTITDWNYNFHKMYHTYTHRDMSIINWINHNTQLWSTYYMFFFFFQMVSNERILMRLVGVQNTKHKHNREVQFTPSQQTQM